jgi:hypothetical protein
MLLALVKATQKTNLEVEDEQIIGKFYLISEIQNHCCF